MLSVIKMTIVTVSQLNKASGEFEDKEMFCIEQSIVDYINLNKQHKDGVIFVDKQTERHFERLIIDNLQNESFLISLDEFKV